MGLLHKLDVATAPRYIRQVDKSQESWNVLATVWKAARPMLNQLRSVGHSALCKVINSGNSKS